MGEAFLRYHLARTGSEVTVRSAGIRAGGQRADPVVLKLLRRRGIRLRKHRSTALTLEELWKADLVVGMASDHIHEIQLMAPDRWPRVFTLRELVRQGNAVGGRRPEETVGDWLARVNSERVRSGPRHSVPQDDISDPFRQSEAHYEHMADEVEALTGRLADLLAGTDSEPLVLAPVSSSQDRPVEPNPRSWERMFEQELDLGALWSDNERRESLASDEAQLPVEPDSPAEGVSMNDDSNDTTENAGESPMNADDVNTDEDGLTQGLTLWPDGSSDALRTAREALQDAQQTVREAAEQLTEALRSGVPAQQAVAADAYTTLGEEVAAVMRAAAAQASAVRDTAECDARALREGSVSDAAETRRKASEESATTRREAANAATTLTRNAEATQKEAREQADALMGEAAAERQRAEAEVDELRRRVTTESAALRDEADLYAKSTRQQAEADAEHLRDEADRCANNVRGLADLQSTEVRDRAQHDASLMRLAAEEDARTIRWDAEQQAKESIREASAKYAELVVAEGELRSRLEGAAGALVSALEGRQAVLPPPRVLAAPDGGSSDEDHPAP